ncbi:Uncharacterised protein [Mycobacteroides abscessus subsp. abscessus]|nr:Uncharacterised protein [Mycobacteroides abscessus subsp. abscessus]
MFVSKDDLPEEQITTTELNEYVEGWGNSDQGYTETLKALEEGK